MPTARSFRPVIAAAGQRPWAGWLFAAPWIVGFVMLVATPFWASLVLSFCRWDMIRPPEWVGFEHYQRLIEEIQSGTGAGLALRNTLYFGLLSVPLSVVFGIALAVMASWPVRGQALFRTVFFLPSMIPVIATCILWMWLLDPQSGWVNQGLAWLHLPPQNWLHQARSAVSADSLAVAGAWWNGQAPLALFGSKDALVMISLWTVGNLMVIYLAGIGDIPRSLYEAAELDGAGRWSRFWHITLPQLTPVIFFNLVTGLIRSVQTFTSIYVLSEGTGAPGESLLVISLHLFLAAFVDLEMGYASAIAWLLFCGLMICTWILFRSSRHWVYYRFAP
jgi:multiple sugar transport system permease protein